MVQHSKDWIVRCVWLAGILTLGCGVFASLWAGLHGLGDAAGAGCCQGVFWGFFACWTLNGLTLIGLLTAQVLNPTLAPIPTISPMSPESSTDN